MVTRTIEVYDNDFLTVATGSPSMVPGSTIINNSDTPDGTVFQFGGGKPATVTLDDTSRTPDKFDDDDYTHHTITDGAGLVAPNTGVEAESLIYVRQLDEFGNQIGPKITITVFSQGNNTQDVWAFHSDTPLVAGADYVKVGGNNIGSVPYSSVSSQPVCYAAGTLIATPDGPRAVEQLTVGDLVTTLDHGPQPIRWIHGDEQSLEKTGPHAKPVLIAAGALGNMVPSQDLIVSPQHRVLVGGHGQLQGWFETSAFAPAKALTKLKGIRHKIGKAKIRWFHFACDRHEIVIANGCLSESLLLGPMVINGLTLAERQAVTRIFGPAPSPGAALNGPPALNILSVGDVWKRLAENHAVAVAGVAKDIKMWDDDAVMDQRDAERMQTSEQKSRSDMGRAA